MILQTAELPIIPYEQCRRLWAQKGGRVHATNVCAGDLDGNSSVCKGDSGGPLVQVVNGTYVQVGIVSWGHFPCGRHDSPAVFGGVSNYVSWLSKKMAEL
jgi:secreted trypsin-like serine protease